MPLDLSAHKILVVDDMTSVRSALRHILSAMGGLQVDFAADGEEALRRLASTSYDIILCDYNLGDGRDGMQVLEEAKHRDLVKLSAVFAMITAESTLAMVLGVVEYRPDDYLVKPITRTMLEDRLERLLARKAVLAEIERAVRTRDLVKAITLCEQRIGEHPLHGLDIMRVEAELYMRLGQYQAAGDVYERAARIRETFWTRLGRGRVRYFLGDYPGAKRAFEELLADNRMHTEAYDWLAKVYEALGDPQGARDQLVTATNLSPRAILRAQTLGELAVRTGDLGLAEQSYRNAVRLGRHSVFRTVSDNTRLAKVLVSKGNSSDATRVLKEARRQFQGQEDATFDLAMSEAFVFNKLGAKDAAGRSLEEAMGLYEKLSSGLAGEKAMELAQVCSVQGQAERAASIMEQTLRRCGDDPAIMAKAKVVYEEMGMMEAGEKLIRAIWDRVVNSNNEGVRLVKEGRLEEAMAVLESAAAEMPDNRTVNLNAARVLLLCMERKGARPEWMERVRSYLGRVPAGQGEQEARYQRLWASYKRLANSPAAKQQPQQAQQAPAQDWS